MATGDILNVLTLETFAPDILDKAQKAGKHYPEWLALLANTRVYVRSGGSGRWLSYDLKIPDVEQFGNLGTSTSTQALDTTSARARLWDYLAEDLKAFAIRSA